jgi:hypothetical protein
VRPRLFITQPAPPVAPPDVSGFDFRPIEFDGASDQYKSHWVGKSESVVVPLDPAGLRCDVRAAADPKSRNYGGVRIPASQMEALRLELSFVNPQAILYVYVDVYDERRRRLGRWRWVVRKNTLPPVEPATYAFVSGEPVAFFEMIEDNVDRPIDSLHVFLRVRPGTEAGFVVHQAELAAPDEARKPRLPP